MAARQQRHLRYSRPYSFCVGLMLIAAALPSVGQTPAPAAKPSTPEQQQPVAVVNRQPISRIQLAKECVRRYGKEVLESEVNKQLILHECKQQGVKITNTDVQEEVERMAEKFGMSVEHFLQTLQTGRNVTPDQYRRDIVWPTLALRKLASPQLTISDAELRKAYESEFGDAVQVRIVVSRSLERAEQLRQQALAAPDKFDRLAKDHSEDENSAATRGLIPPIYRHTGDPKIEEVAFGLRPGQISEVVQVANQYLVLKCERHLPPRELSPGQREVAEAKLREALSDRKLRSAAADVFRKLQDRASIQNVYNDAALRQQRPGVAAVVNGRAISMDHLGDLCVQRYGEAVLDGEINRMLLTQAMRRRSLEVSQADLQEEIRRAAESFGIVDAQGTPDVDRWLSQVTAEGDVTVDTYVRDRGLANRRSEEACGSWRENH